MSAHLSESRSIARTVHMYALLGEDVDEGVVSGLWRAGKWLAKKTASGIVKGTLGAAKGTAALARGSVKGASALARGAVKTGQVARAAYRAGNTAYRAGKSTWDAHRAMDTAGDPRASDVQKNKALDRAHASQAKFAKSLAPTDARIKATYGGGAAKSEPAANPSKPAGPAAPTSTAAKAPEPETAAPRARKVMQGAPKDKSVAKSAATWSALRKQKADDSTPWTDLGHQAKRTQATQQARSAGIRAAAPSFAPGAASAPKASSTPASASPSKEPRRVSFGDKALPAAASTKQLPPSSDPKRLPASTEPKRLPPASADTATAQKAGKVLNRLQKTPPAAPSGPAPGRVPTALRKKNTVVPVKAKAEGRWSYRRSAKSRTESVESGSVFRAALSEAMVKAQEALDCGCIDKIEDARDALRSEMQAYTP